MRVSPIQEIDGRLVLPAAPETENDAARLRDAVSHMVVTSTDTVTVDDELYGPRNPGDTHLVILFTGAGEKRAVLATAYDGQTITIVKNDDASSIVLEPSGDGRTFRGNSSEATVQTTIAERRAFTIAALGDDYDYVGIPQVDGAVSTASLADAAVAAEKLATGSVTTPKIGDTAVTAAKIAPVALNGWYFGVSPTVPEPTADAHPTTRAYVNKRSFSASGVSWTDGTNNGTADVHAERVGNVVALRVSVTASGSTGPSIVSAVGFLPEWARPSVTISSLSDYHTASNTIFAIGAHADGQVTLQKRLISSSGITTENWTSSEERTLLVSYPVPAP